MAQTDRGGVYELSARLASLGEYGCDVAVRTKALPLMRQLHEAFDETVNLGLLEGLHIRCMQVIETTQALRWIVNPGAMDMPQTTVPGRAIVAYLPSEQQAWFVVKVCATLKGRTRKTACAELEVELAVTGARGFAQEEEEEEEETVAGVVCVALPLADFGELRAAVSVSMPVHRFPAATSAARWAAVRQIREMSAANA